MEDIRKFKKDESTMYGVCMGGVYIYIYMLCRIAIETIALNGGDDIKRDISTVIAFQLNF